MAKPGYSSWYNTFLTPNEQRGQVSHRATVARRKAKEMKVNVGETKRVKVDENAPTVSRSSKAGLIRENAQRQNGGVKERAVQRTPRQDTRARIAEAIQRTPSQSSQNQSVRHYRTKNGWGGVVYRDDTLKNSDKQKKR